MEKIHKNIPQELMGAKSGYRSRLELLRSRIDLLVGEDKLLMTMHLENGNSFRQMARLANVSESNIARRIHKIAKRLLGSEYIICLRNRKRFSKAELTIARDHFLLGLSIKTIADKHHSSYYGIRETLKRIQKIINSTDGEKSEA